MRIDIKTSRVQIKRSIIKIQNLSLFAGSLIYNVQFVANLKN